MEERQERAFPILKATSRDENIERKKAGCPASIPWGLIAPHDAQAQKNHGGQSLERLAARGGLAPEEALAVLADKPWHELARLTTADAVGRLISLVEDYELEQQALRAARSGAFVLPDGSGFSTATLPLPKDHWIYAEQPPPPMGLRCGTANKLRRVLVEYVQEAARYAVRDATMCGREKDFDPDAIVQSMVVGLLGYSTEDGLGSEEWQNPPEPLSQLIYVGYGCPENRETRKEP
jgi:hypothetical protein